MLWRSNNKNQVVWVLKSGSQNASAVSPASITIVPGGRDSGLGHWQSLWAERLPHACRVVQDDWITPTRLAWVGPLEKTVLAAPHPVVIVAHGLGCIATTSMGAQAAARVCSALLVAPTDPERRTVLNDCALVALSVRSIVVASSNDPYCPLRLAGACARAWGRECVRMQNAGHLHIDSGHGEWPLDGALLRSLQGDPTASRAPVPGHAQASPAAPVLQKYS